jgi:hypothetical protein
VEGYWRPSHSILFWKISRKPNTLESILMKFVLILVLAGFVAACAGAPSPPPAHQAGDHIVQGGSFTGEGMIYFPLSIPKEKKK